MHPNYVPIDGVAVDDQEHVSQKLALENYGAGYALLRPEQSQLAICFAARYVLTDKGRRDLAIAQACDRGPSVADVRDLDRGS